MESESLENLISRLQQGTAVMRRKFHGTSSSFISGQIMKFYNRRITDGEEILPYQLADMQENAERLGMLITRLAQDDRMKEALSAAKSVRVRRRLYQEYGI